MIKILIAEDDPSISELISISLRKSGYKTIVASDGAQAASILDKETFDLLLLDIMLPKIDGYSLMEYAKQFELPVIFITAKSDISDRVKGLKMGAEDYIVKPFDVLELLARVETVLRRYNKTQKTLTFRDITVDTVSREVYKNGEKIELTLKEYDLLLFFLRNQGIALYRETIYEHVWEESYFGNTRTLDLHIQRLRKKLDLGDCIESIYKIGYRLRTEEK